MTGLAVLGSTGTIGANTLALVDRFPDRYQVVTLAAGRNLEKLREQIFDATKVNPKTVMPPFGRHNILTQDEIDKIVEFVSTL